MALRALQHQEKAVEDLRSRTNTLLAAAALTASFLGGVAIKHGFNWAAALALLAFAVTSALAIYVIWPKELLFAIDVREFYPELYPDRDQAETFLVRAAYAIADAYEYNRCAVTWLERGFRAAAVALGIETVLWAVALGVS